MPSASPAVARVLAVVVAALLVAGGITVAAQEGGTTAGRTAPPAALPSTAAAPGATASTAVPGRTSTSTGAGPSAAPSTSTPAGASTTTRPAPTVAPLATVAGSVPDPGQPTATLVGSYRYAMSSSGGRSGSSSGTLTEQVTTQAVSGGATRQTVVDRESGSSSGGSPDQGNTTQDVQWDAQGYKQVATTISAGGQSVHCAWNPAVVELAAPLAVTHQWTLSGSCPITVLGQPGTVQLSGQATVTGTQVVSVGADRVSVWVIADSYTIVVHLPSLGVNGTIHQSATDKVSGRDGLLVEEDATDTSTFGGKTDTSTNRQVLEDIHPS